MTGMDRQGPIWPHPADDVIQDLDRVLTLLDQPHKQAVIKVCDCVPCGPGQLQSIGEIKLVWHKYWIMLNHPIAISRYRGL